MPQYVLNLLLAILIDAVTAIVTYLEGLLMSILNSANEPWANHREFV
ncbi:hypothetical protein PCA31118_03936 [Pandoraea captiosa]|uniref:Uncharacterized protein n=1 Tax=Pandoraea captiosa TaxID=2508302 RepID=A0A5E5AGN0_9BURK|nr:hypothetical protein [Pandoraea captiosa]VVE71653.1 hypothetical protein PCA31118_03936 [Pandoraea captiosa]